MSSALLLTIALGVGSNAAVYGFLQGLLYPATPLGGSGRIVSIFKQDRFREAGPLSPDDYELLQSSRRAFDWIGAVRIKPGDVRFGAYPEIATIAAATPDLATALAIRLDDGVVISHRVWESEFGGRDNAVGTRIQIDDVDYRIKGVAPERLDGLYSDRAVDLWIPLEKQDLEGDSRDRQQLWVLARLRHDVSTRLAQATLRSGFSSLHEVNVTPFTGIAPNMARGLSRIGVFLNFAAGAVFFIACINVASLLLGRALRRSHETSLRLALGATRADLLWELLSDSIVITFAGGVLGSVLAISTTRALPALLFEEDAQRLSFATHLLPILTASLVCIGTIVLCGMMPILGTQTDRPWTVLQRETGSPSKGIHLLRYGLVVAQITVCCMLVIGTALLLDGLHAASKTSAGHRLGDPILLTVDAQTPLGVDVAYLGRVEQKAMSMPGLSPLAWTAQLPGNQPAWQPFRIQPSTSLYRDVAMDVAWLTPDSFKWLDSQPVAGRMFGIYDPSYRAAVIDEAAAAELFGRRTVGIVIRDHAGQPIEVIGVVKRKSTDGILLRRPTIYYGYVDQSAAPTSIRHAQFRVPVAPPVAGVDLNANVVSANYFGALDLPLIAGQKFADHPMPGYGRVGVINQEAADLYFNGKPLGAGVIDDKGVRTQIIGVVKSPVFGTFERRAVPAIYFPMSQDCSPRMTLILKDLNRKRGGLADLRRQIESVPGHGSFPVVVSTLDRQLAQSGLAALRIATLLGGASAAIGMILSILGLLSAQSDAEHQRQRDRALRLALGAQRWRIVFMVVINAARLAVVGTLTGTLLTFAFLRLLIADITVASPPFQMWLIAPLLSAAVVTLASLYPARRASAISPLEIMRDL